MFTHNIRTSVGGNLLTAHTASGVKIARPVFRVFSGNTGTHYELQRERLKAEIPQGLSTDAHNGGGLFRSSKEVVVMTMERREQLISVICIEQLIKLG